MIILSIVCCHFYLATDSLFVSELSGENTSIMIAQH